MTHVGGREGSAILLAFRRAVRELVDEGEDGGLQGLVDALVPATANAAFLFVLGNDGRLHLRNRAVAVGSLEPSLPASPLARDSPHPASAAVRECALVLVGQGDIPAIWPLAPPSPPPSGSYHAVSVPITRDREAVGALHLHRSPSHAWTTEELDELAQAGESISLAVENRRLRREVEAARRAKTDFLSVMNHELRTPLTAVVGYADLLEAGIPGPVSERQQVHLGRIKDSAWELLELIEGILSYARYDGGEPDLQVRRTQPEVLARDALSLVEATAAEKGLELSLETIRPLPRLRTDPQKARRVLFHLLSNAVKFTRHGCVQVTVSADPQWVVFSVSDTGIGIRSEDRGSIFEPFWQGESPETRTTGGTGMGLALAQRLTELLSGEISLESEPERGSNFILRLPRDGPHSTFP